LPEGAGPVRCRSVGPTRGGDGGWGRGGTVARGQYPTVDVRGWAPVRAGWGRRGGPGGEVRRRCSGAPGPGRAGIGCGRAGRRGGGGGGGGGGGTVARGQ